MGDTPGVAAVISGSGQLPDRGCRAADQARLHDGVSGRGRWSLAEVGGLPGGMWLLGVAMNLYRGGSRALSALPFAVATLYFALVGGAAAHALKPRTLSLRAPGYL